MKIKPTTFYIVRHGESEYNAKRLLAGHIDTILTKNGEEQARVLGSTLKDISFDHIFASDLTRAIRTAEIIALEKKMAVVTTKLLREQTFGKFEGKPYTVFENELKKYVEEYQKLSSDQKKKYRYPSMESEEEYVSRFFTFLRETSVAYPGKTILIVSHGAMIRTFLVHIGWGTYEDVPHNAVSNSGYVKLESDGVDFDVKETKGIIRL